MCRPGGRILRGGESRGFPECDTALSVSARRSQLENQRARWNKSRYELKALSLAERRCPTRRPPPATTGTRQNATPSRRTVHLTVAAFEIRFLRVEEVRH